MDELKRCDDCLYFDECPIECIEFHSYGTCDNFEINEWGDDDEIS